MVELGAPGYSQYVELVPLAQLEYYTLPKPRFHERVLDVNIRTFLNPGWAELLKLECKDCTSENELSIRPLQRVCYT